MTQLEGAFRESKLFNVEHYLENWNPCLETCTGRKIFLQLRLEIQAWTYSIQLNPTNKKIQYTYIYISTIIHVRYLNMCVMFGS